MPGCDWFTPWGDGYGRPQVRLPLQTDDGASVLLEYRGIVHASPAFVRAVEQNRQTDWGDQYIGTSEHLGTLKRAGRNGSMARNAAKIQTKPPAIARRPNAERADALRSLGRLKTLPTGRLLWVPVATHADDGLCSDQFAGPDERQSPSYSRNGRWNPFSILGPTSCVSMGDVCLSRATTSFEMKICPALAAAQTRTAPLTQAPIRRSSVTSGLPAWSPILALPNLRAPLELRGRYSTGGGAAPSLLEHKALKYRCEVSAADGHDARSRTA